MNKPLHTLQINSISACFEIKINDIPLYTERKGKPTSAEIPINHLLIPGFNKVKVKYDKIFQDHSKTDFEIFLREIDAPRSSRKPVAKIDFPDYIHDDKLKSSVIPAETTFQSNLSTIPAWTTCPVLLLNEKINDEILTVYRQYFKFLKEKNVEGILDLSAIKDNDFEKSYFMQPGEQQARIRASFSEVFNNPDFDLIDFDFQKKTPGLHGFGKLVTLINVDNRSPLQFYNNATGVTKSYPIYLGRKDNYLKILG